MSMMTDRMRGFTLVAFERDGSSKIDQPRPLAINVPIFKNRQHPSPLSITPGIFREKEWWGTKEWKKGEGAKRGGVSN
jgi:hypothetical protein